MENNEFQQRLNSNEPRVVDPPGGWMYGFPAVWDPSAMTLEEFYRSKGYPEGDLDLAYRHTRMWFID